MAGVHSHFQIFANYWKNGLKVGQFVREGGHSLFNTLYLLVCLSIPDSFRKSHWNRKFHWKNFQIDFNSEIKTFSQVAATVMVGKAKPSYVYKSLKQHFGVLSDPISCVRKHT